MASITQDMRYRLSSIRFAQKHGVTKAAVKYKINRAAIPLYDFINASSNARSASALQADVF